MEGFMFSPYNFSGYLGCGPILRGNLDQKPYWVRKGGLYVTPEATDYMEMCKRAQLKAILAQVNPHLTPRLRTVNTKDFGVQVNDKVDAIVQCSIGPKTLFYRERNDPPFMSPRNNPYSPIWKGKGLPTTPVNNVRFTRPLAIYSPVFDRGFFLRSVKTIDDSACDEGAEDCSRLSDEDAEADQTMEDEGLPEDHGDVKKSLHQLESKGSYCQFLEQRYGFFHCSKCNIRWESAYVWCISGTSKVYFRQLCRKCQVGFNPYRVEDIQCQECSQACCSCERKQRHVDRKRPHRQDLCGRCKGKRLSCDSTYSFKYII